jgi:hypothetical protein
MPIRINLLAEAQAAEEQRRNDPVKRGAWVGGFLVALVAIWALDVQLHITQAKGHQASIDSVFKAKDPQYAAVTNTQNKIIEINGKLAQLDRLTTNRFLWGPVLNSLQKAAIGDVAVTEFRGDQNIVRQDAHMVGNIGYGAGVTELVQVSIMARDNNPNDAAYNKFKESLNQAEYFVKNTGRKDSFIIDGVLSPIAADPNDPSKQFLTFTLVSHFPEIHHGE